MLAKPRYPVTSVTLDNVVESVAASNLTLIYDITPITDWGGKIYGFSRKIIDCAIYIIIVLLNNTVLHSLQTGFIINMKKSPSNEGLLSIY